jgi:hypothetical protein
MLKIQNHSDMLNAKLLNDITEIHLFELAGIASTLLFSRAWHNVPGDDMRESTMSKNT